MIAPVDKIVGPGNAFVAAAKRQVFGQVGIDSIAGPSEILVVADAQNDPAWIAADLLSQAEHDEAAQSILITDNAAFADAVDTAVSAMLPTLDRAAVASQSWQDNGAIIIVPHMDEMPAIVDRIAAEHLELALDNADEWAEKNYPCWRNFSWPLHTRGDWRLCGWAQSCFANSAYSSVLIWAWCC